MYGPKANTVERGGMRNFAALAWLTQVLRIAGIERSVQAWRGSAYKDLYAGDSSFDDHAGI